MSVRKFLITTSIYLFLLLNNYLDILELKTSTLLLNTWKKKIAKNILSKIMHEREIRDVLSVKKDDAHCETLINCKNPIQLFLSSTACQSSQHRCRYPFLSSLALYLENKWYW